MTTIPSDGERSPDDHRELRERMKLWWGDPSLAAHAKNDDAAKWMGDAPISPMEEINNLCIEFHDAALRCMDDLGPAHYKAVLADLRRVVDDLEETAAKWAWAGRVSARELAKQPF